MFSTVVGYIKLSAKRDCEEMPNGGPDVFSSYATEMSLAATPGPLLDRNQPAADGRPE